MMFYWSYFSVSSELVGATIGCDSCYLMMEFSLGKSRLFGTFAGIFGAIAAALIVSSIKSFSLMALKKVN